MARTSAPGGRILVDASSPIDTAPYGMVSILVGPAGASVTVLVGDTEAVDTVPVTTLIDPDTGDAIDTETWTVPEREGSSGAVLAYIGEKRYLQVTSTGTAYVLLEEARKTTPIRYPPEDAEEADGSRGLTEVIADAASGSTVRLTADFTEAVAVPQGKTLTLDLNGHSITSDGASPAITNAGTLTLRGGTVASGSGQAILNTGTLTVASGTVDATAGTYAVESTGTVILASGTFRSDAEDCIYIHGGTARITGGSYRSVQYSALWTPAGDVKVTGGTFVSESCSKCYSRYRYTISNNGATMEVSNVTVTGTQGGIAASKGLTVIRSGTVETVKCAQNHNTAFHALYVAGEQGETCCAVYGGSFTAANRACVQLGLSTEYGGNQDKANLVIHGGSFATGGGPTIAVVSVDNDTANVPSCAVLGGTFDRQLVDGIIADGYAQTESDGVWTVAKA